MSKKYLYCVHDSRAQFDIDRSVVLECLGNSYSKKDLKEWSGQSAVLVKSTLNSTGEYYENAEIVMVIK